MDPSSVPQRQFLFFSFASFLSHPFAILISNLGPLPAAAFPGNSIARLSGISSS